MIYYINKYMATFKSSFMTIQDYNKSIIRDEVENRKILRINDKKQKELNKEAKLALKLEKEELKSKELQLKNKVVTTKKKNIPLTIAKSEPTIISISKQNIDITIDTITSKLSNMINDENLPIQNYKPIYNILKNDDTIIEKIIHIADIHIRLSKLHDEYNIVFNKLYVELYNLKNNGTNAIICLCGDLLHSKDELKPDTIILTWNFIKNLSDIFPLIIITGNHDVIELNNNKIDSITAILRDRPIENTYYLLNSGVYIYNNIIFGVSSIIDKYMLNKNTLDDILLEYYPTFTKTNQHKYIALYHGSVDGAVNDNGIRIRGNKKLKDFASIINNSDTYDYILLGDIHKFQYLDKNKTVAYSSSLISQNFGETDIYHGYLEWNILLGSSQYHILSNDNAYHKINIDKLVNINDINLDDANPIILNESKLNEHLSKINSGFLRIEFDEILIKKINRDHLKKQINNIFPLLTISWQLIFIKSSIESSIKSSDKNITESFELNNNVNNLSNVIETIIDEPTLILDNFQYNTDYMNKLIRQFITTRFYGTTDNMIDNVLEYLNKIILETQSNNTEIEYVKSDWKLIWLSFDYMYGYGQNNVIDFTKYPINEIVGIFGDNAIGKSSIIDIITYMLYSRSARDESSTNPRDIVNVTVNKASGILILESNKIKYLIKRNVTRSYSNATKRFNVRGTLRTYKMIEVNDQNNQNNIDMFKLHDQLYKLQSLTEENRICTDDILVPIIGTYDNFITTSILLQGNHKTFKSKTNAEKKEFLCQILKLDYFKKCDSVINDRFKSLKANYNALLKVISFLQENNKSTKSIDQLNIELEHITIQSEQLESYINNAHNDIHSLSLQLVTLLFDKIIDIDTEKNNILNYYQTIAKNEHKINDNNITIKSINKLLLELSTLKNQDNIILQYSNYINNIKEKQNIIHSDINKLFLEKQQYPLIKINNDFTESQQNELFIDFIKSISNLDISINKISKFKTNILNHSEKLINLHIDISIINDEMLDNYKNELYVLHNKLLDTTKLINEHKYKIESVITDISKLDLIQQNDTEIIQKYEEYQLDLIKSKELIIQNIEDLHKSKQSFSHMSVDTNMTIDDLDNEQNIFLNLLSNIDELKISMYNNNIITNHNDKIIINVEYLEQLENHKAILKNKLESLLNNKFNKKYLSNTITDSNIYTFGCAVARSITWLCNNKKICLEYLNDSTIQQIFLQKEDIILKYNLFITNNTKLIFDSLNDLEKNIINNKLDGSINLIKIIKDSLKFTLNNNSNDHIIITKYNELMVILQEYNLKQTELFNINQDIDTYNCINLIDKDINIIKLHLENIDDILKYINLVSTHIYNCNYIEDDIVVTLDEINNNISNISTNNETLNNINHIDLQIYKLKNDIIHLDNINSPIVIKYNNFILQQSKFIELNNIKTNLLNDYTKLQSLLDETNNKIILFETNINYYLENKISIEKNNEYENKINKFFDKIENELNNYNMNPFNLECIDDIDIILDNLNNLKKEFEEKSKECKNNIIIIKSNYITIEKLNTIDENINKLKDELNILNDPNNIIISNYQNLQKELLLNGTYNAEINELNNINCILTTENTSFKFIIENLDKDIENYLKSKDHINHNILINKQINQLKDEIKNNGINSKELNNQYIIIKSEITELFKTIEKINETNKELLKIKTEIDIYDILSKLTCRDGVQLYLLASSLEKITNKVNNILEPFINKTVKLTLNNDMIELTILSKDDNVIHTISGMESFMLDLVFKIIIGHISVIPKSNIIFMDESISVLDKHRMASIEELFSFLRQYYETVFIITHMKQVNNHINNSIEIIKYNDNSLIYNISLPRKKQLFIDLPYNDEIDNNIKKINNDNIDIDINANINIKSINKKKAKKQDTNSLTI